MKTADFDFSLPGELIAQYPLAERTASRLLHVCGNKFYDRRFVDLLNLLNAGDLLVFNNTKVIPARLHGQKQTGGQVEVLVERVLDQHRVLAHVRASKSPRPGNLLLLESGLQARMLARQDDLFELEFLHEQSVIELLEQFGHMPLPPYITRKDDDSDQQRYQTVYAKHPGAVAAPTAGLHFDETILRAIQNKGIASAFVTLHVGAGTFQPVRVDDVREHVMHAEYYSLDDSVVTQVNMTRQNGGRVIAVGTTAVRCLESASQDGEIKAQSGDTKIFIYPGYQFKVIDALITNFHLPQSTLLMLVSALGGYDNVMSAYRHAVAEKYRFFSYGDAMFIERQTLCRTG